MYPTGDILTEYTLDDFRPAFVDLKSFDWHVRNRPTFWAEKDQRMFSWRLSGVHFQIGNTTIFSLVLFMYMNMFNWRHRHRLIDCCWHEQRLTTLCTAKNEGSKNSWAQGLWSINKYISYNKIKLNKIKKSFIHQSLLILTFWNPIIILWKKLICYVFRGGLCAFVIVFLQRERGGPKFPKMSFRNTSQSQVNH